jgi:predicted porin
MKKSLVALAALAATSAFAQSSVTLYGNIDQSLFKASSDGNNITSSNSNGGSTSLWGIRGTEDLGGGTKASFDLKSELTLANGQTGSSTTGVAAAATGAEVFNRGAWIGIENNNLGAFKVGRQNDVWWETSTGFNNTGINSFGWANATAMVSGITSLPLLYVGTYNAGNAPSVNGLAATLGTAGTLAAPNPSAQGTGAAFFGGLTYETPTWNGLTAKIQRGVPKAYYTANGNVAQIGGYSLKYAQGPLSLAWATNSKTDTNGDVAMKQTMLGAKYVMGQYTFTIAQNQTRMGGLALVTSGNNIAAHDADVLAYGVGYQLTPAWKVDVGYTVLKDKTDSTNQFKQTGVVGTYAFSKRTSWYVGYGAGSNSGNSRFGSVYAGSANSQPYAGVGGTGAGNVTSSMLGDSDRVIITGLRHQF